MTVQLTFPIARYFDVVDPVYPIVPRDTFQTEYDFFWSLSPMERSRFDGSLVSLIFVMLAMGTQFVTLPSPDEQEQTAEFYGDIPKLASKTKQSDLSSVGIAPSIEIGRLP